MIQSLSIQNYALIEALQIDFSNNLTIITGETGAGKSIIMGALGLVMGRRAESKVLFNMAEKCVVEAHFNIAAYRLQELFEAEDIDYSDETIIRREILPSGKSRAFINDTPVKVQALEHICGALIDLHQQFDTLDIQTPLFQTRVVDALANHAPLLQQYQSLYRQYQEAARRLRQMQEEQRRAEQEDEFARFQLKELKKAQLREGEEEELEQLQKQLSHAEEIQTTIGSAVGLLSEQRDGSIVDLLSDAMRPLVNILPYHKDLNALHERLEALRGEVEDISALLQEIAYATEYNPTLLENTTTRLNQINRLLKKYNALSSAQLLQTQKDLQAKITARQNLSADIANLELSIAQQSEQLRTLGRQISAGRKSVVGAFEQKIQKLLTQLSMPHARLKVDIQSEQEISATGTDLIQFLFTANKGSRLEAIKQVASGGELSRLALCIKSLVASAIPLPTLIFDEIDAGVSGEVAHQMSLILRDLAAEHQVITITHSPQIAAKAHTHYFVHKSVREDRTATAIRQLTLDERLIEIAKMLSGNPPTAAAKLNAQELLAGRD